MVSLSLMGPEETLPKSVVSIFKDYESKSRTMHLSATESQTLISRLAENFVQTIIVIDALDECDWESWEQLLDALKIILKSLAGLIKFFVTSRDADHDFSLEEEELPNINININPGDNSGDIAAFVRAEVEKCISTESLLRGSVAPEIKESIIKELTLGADGMFLWASLNLKSICEEKSPKAIRKALRKLPRGLNDTYSVIWDKICRLSDGNKDLAIRTLKWTMCAQSPLAAAEIIDAVSIEPMEFTEDDDDSGLTVQDLLDVCQNLIVMDEQLGVLRTANFSVNEFLEDHIKISEAYNYAAEICLTLMRRPKIYDEPPMPSIYSHKYDGEWKPLTPRPKIRDEPHPLRYYMFHHWAAHLGFSGDASSGRLLELRQEFFQASTAYDAWLNEAMKQNEDFTPIRPEEKLTPLWVASYYQLWGICKNLLKDKVYDRNVRNKSGETPLFVAARFGYVGIVELLFKKKGVDINAKNYSAETPLWAAASKGHAPIVKLFLEKEGVDINPQNNNYATSLWIAASEGHEAIVKLLLEKEGVRLRTFSGDPRSVTPLEIARRNGHRAVAEVNLITSLVGIEITANNIFNPSASY
ncbi:hypothetical protein RUND412_001754 [Rhizina undulata]